MKLNSKQLGLIAIAVLAVAAISGAAAVTYLTAPEYISGTPIDKPTPTPTASPTAAPVAYEMHLTSNVTDPFYKGDTLRLTATITPAVTGASVTLYNNDNLVTTALTDATGKAVFDRAPVNPFEYSITALVP